MTGWSEAAIPDLCGRRAVITGGNGGIGFEAASLLARHGARVTITSREATRGDVAAAAIRADVPGARVDAVMLDLADLRSVRAAAAAIAAQGGLDLLVNNAGVMAPPRRLATRDGFEVQFGTNHLGHFALTGLLLDRCPPARIVTVSSIAHHRGAIDFDDLQSERRYAPMRAYAQSKLANLIFALDLQRRLARQGAGTISLAAHPGVARTNLFANMFGGRGRAIVGMGNSSSALRARARRGAAPIVMAATDPALPGGAYIGPDGWREMRGDPAPAAIAPQALDSAAAAELWRRSEVLTGVSYLS